jgi:hypothetical protein
MKLSEAQIAALETAVRSEFAYRIPDKTTRDIFGLPIPSLAVYRKLEKLGLLYFTDEDPESDFDWSQTVEITEAGREALKLEV